MAKDLKKKKKSKKRSRHSDEAPKQLQVSLDTSIASTATSGCSWGSAFAAAAQIEPAEGIEDEEFVQRTDTSSGKEQVDAGLVKISQLASAVASAETAPVPALKKVAAGSGTDQDGTTSVKEGYEINNTKPRHKRKRSSSKDSSSAVETTEGPTSLEGRMVPHPNSSEQVMVLVDSKKHVVYSAMDRNPSVDYLRLGSIDDGTGDILWDNDAFSSSQQDEEIKHDSHPCDSSPASFPFPTDADDHCESPLQAYHDILPFLEKLCHGNKKECTIYDPYYCNGAVKRNLKELGFPSVHNEKVDCYQVWSSRVGRYPDFQVLITNPPYSDDHIPKLLQHVTSQNFGQRPWFLLLPTWVHKKDYYKTATCKIAPFYLVPKKRYTYLPPKQFREKKASDVHKKSSPFVSMWYIWGGTPEKNEELIQSYAQSDGSCDLARSKSALRDLRRKGKKKQKK